MYSACVNVYAMMGDRVEHEIQATERGKTNTYPTRRMYRPEIDEEDLLNHIFKWRALRARLVEQPLEQVAL